MAKQETEQRLYRRCEQIAQGYGTGVQEAKSDGLWVVPIESEDHGSWTGSGRTRRHALQSLASNFD